MIRRRKSYTIRLNKLFRRRIDCVLLLEVMTRTRRFPSLPLLDHLIRRSYSRGLEDMLLMLIQVYLALLLNLILMLMMKLKSATSLKMNLISDFDQAMKDTGWGGSNVC